MIGFMGAGNMAGAIIRGAVKNGAVAAGEIVVYDVDERKALALKDELGVAAARTPHEMLDKTGMLLMAVKPNVAGQVYASLRDKLRKKAVLSICAGWSADMIRAAVPEDTRILRIMPNTPALVGAGMTAFSRDTSLTEDEKIFAQKLFSALGRLVWVEEYQMEAVIGLSGSGPAYAYLFIEALADGGVRNGLTRPQALEMAAQTLLGSAKMVLESGQHPGALKDAVCSPGGTTIAAVESLEKNAFRGAVMQAVSAACEKAMEMKK